MTGPLLVVGPETTLPSGFIDLAKIEALPGTQPVKTSKLRASHFDPATAIRTRSEVAEILAALVQRMSGEAKVP